MENKITMIDVDLLDPHPNNPRRDLGDLTELTASISANGVMQNLTVVPRGNRYTVIIGHRRLAAAKQAGLKKVPCIVTVLDIHEQAAMMLTENMQRSDLTVPEQVHGIQMCLDLGMDEEKIREKTGFSKKTMKQRMALLRYSPDKLKEYFDLGLTLDVFAKINSIEDEERRTKIEKSIGQGNLDYLIRSALQEQERHKILVKTSRKLDELGVENKTKAAIQTDFVWSVEIPTDTGRWETSTALYGYDSDKDFVPVSGEKYAYVEGYTYIKIFKFNPVTEPNKTDDSKKRVKEAVGRLDLKSKECFERRINFMRKLTFPDQMTAEELVNRFFHYTLVHPYDIRVNKEVFLRAYNRENRAKEESFDFDDMIAGEQFGSGIGYKALNVAILLYSLMESESLAPYRPWNGEFRKDPDLEELYEYLEFLGYKKSQLEEHMLDGTDSDYQNEGRDG